MLTLERFWDAPVIFHPLPARRMADLQIVCEENGIDPSKLAFACFEAQTHRVER